MREVLEKCLIESGKVIMSFYQGEFSSKQKADNSVVTEADVKAEQTIKRIIKKHYPTHGIIGEEEGLQKGEEYTWIIDPIDGTASFAAGLPNFGTLIGVMKGDEVVLAGAHIPAQGLIYLAEKGKGTTCNGKQVHVTKETDLKKKLVWYGTDPKDLEITEREGRAYARLVLGCQYVVGTNGPEQCTTVADGRVGGYITLRAKIWDVVALKLILEEAGGVMTDYLGKEHDFNITDLNTDFTMVGGNPVLHKRLIEILTE